MFLPIVSLDGFDTVGGRPFTDGEAVDILWPDGIENRMTIHLKYLHGVSHAYVECFIHGAHLLCRLRGQMLVQRG